jgi:hypothetical protein
MNKLMVQGKQKFMGITIPVLTGGFGLDTKCVLGRDIAIIHGKELGHINRDINVLITRNRITEGTHYINLLNPSYGYRELVEEMKLKGSNKTKDIFLLSERGYASLIKYMDDNKSWEVHDNFVDEYFQLKEIVKKVSENYSLRTENLNRLFSRVYPQEFETIANEILEFHVSLGKKQRLDERHKRYDSTEYKQFTRDKMVEALTEIQKDVNNNDIVSIRLYAKDLIIKLQGDYRLTNNRSDGKVIGNLKRIKSLEQARHIVSILESIN